MKILSTIMWVFLSAAIALSQDNGAANHQTNVIGCLSGNAGNYTLTEDQSGNAFSISDSAVDLKPHLGHEVELIAQVLGGDNSGRSIRVKELKMISEHCSSAAVTGGHSTTTGASNATPSGSSASSDLLSRSDLSASQPPTPASRKSKHMPNTASPLPLLGALGLGLLFAGLVSLRKRHNYS